MYLDYPAEEENDRFMDAALARFYGAEVVEELGTDNRISHIVLSQPHQHKLAEYKGHCVFDKVYYMFSLFNLNFVTTLFIMSCDIDIKSFIWCVYNVHTYSSRADSIKNQIFQNLTHGARK